MNSEISDLIALNPSSAHFNDICRRISKDINEHVVDFVTIIENFSAIITSKNIDEQKTGVAALSNIFKYLPNDQLNEIQLKAICEFFCSLLKTSNQLSRNLLEGVQQLIKQKHLTSDQAWSLLTVITAQVDLTRRSNDDRLLIQRTVFEIINKNVKQFIKENRNLQLYLRILQILDGETDPVCISTILNFLPTFFDQFTIDPNHELIKEFSKVLWLYFPINYPSSALVQNISREVLSKQLENCILGNRSFAKYTIDNVLEQLNALEDKFEFDTLILLRNSFAKYPIEIYVEHFNSLVSVIKYEAFYNNDKRVNQVAIECFGQLLCSVKNILQTDNRLREILEKLIKNDLYNKLSSELEIATGMLLEVIKIECDLSKDVVDHLTPILIKEISDGKNHLSIIIKAMESIQLYRKEINIDFNLLCFNLLKNQEVSENIVEAKNAYLDAILCTINLFTFDLRNELWKTLKFVIDNKSVIQNKSNLINAIKKLSLMDYDKEISNNIFGDLNENNLDNAYEVLVLLAEVSPEFSYDIIVQKLLTFGFSKVIVFKHCVAILKTVSVDNPVIKLILNYAIFIVNGIQSDNEIESDTFFKMIVQLFYLLFLKLTSSFEEVQKSVLPYVKNLTLLAVYDAVFRYCNKPKLIAVLDNNNYFEKFIDEYKSWNVVNNYYLNYWSFAIVYIFMKLNDENILNLIENVSIILENSEKSFYLWSWTLTAFLILNDDRCGNMINKIFDHLEQMYTFVFQIVSTDFIEQDRELFIQNVLYKQTFFVKAIAKFSELINNLHKHSTDSKKHYQIIYLSYGYLLATFPESLFVIHFKQFSGELLNILQACEANSATMDGLCLKLGKLITESHSGAYNETLVPLCLEVLKKPQNIIMRLTMLRILIEVAKNSKAHELERFRTQILNLSRVMLNDHKRIIRMKASELVICSKLANC